LKAAEGLSHRTPDAGQHAGAHSGLIHPSGSPLGPHPSAHSGQGAGQATVYARPCLWCRLHRPLQKPNTVQTLTEGSDGICAECVAAARDGFAAAARERQGRRLTAEMYTLGAAIIVLLPVLLNQQDEGWPGVDSEVRSEYTDALTDLLAAVGDR